MQVAFAADEMNGGVGAARELAEAAGLWSGLVHEVQSSFVP